MEVCVKKLVFFSSLIVSGLIEASLLVRADIQNYIAHDNGSDTIQLIVPNQFIMLHGNASCGYQTAFNGPALKNVLYASPQDRPAALAFLAHEGQARHEKFCLKESPWRQRVILSRGQQEAKVSLEEQMGLLFNDATIVDQSVVHEEGYLYRQLLGGTTLEFPEAASEEEQNLWHALWNEVRNVAGDLSLSHREIDDNALFYTIYPHEIKQQFLERLRGRINAATENLAPYLVFEADEAKIDEFIDFSEADVHVPLKDEGNWVDDLEIVQVLRDCEQADLRTTFVIGSSLASNSPLTDDQALFTSDDFTFFKQAFQEDGGVVTGIFHVYAKEVSSEPSVAQGDHSVARFMSQAADSNSQGHWYCVVAHKVGNERQYLIADSATNHSRVEHYRVKELRCLLEGVDYIQNGLFGEWIADELIGSSPSALLKRSLEDEKYIPKFAHYMLTNCLDIDAHIYEKNTTLGTYLNEKLREIEEDAVAPNSALKQRILTILELAEEYRSGLYASQRRAQSQWLKPSAARGAGLADTDERLAELIVQCAEHSARLEELKTYLLQVKDTRSVDLAAMRYRKGTLADQYHTLSARVYPHKEAVAALLTEQTLRVLMLKPYDATTCADCVTYFNAHPCDISKVPYSLDPHEKTYATLGEWLKAQEGDLRYASMVAAVNRSYVKPSGKPPKGQSKQSKPHIEIEKEQPKVFQWLTREKSAGLGALFGIGCYMLYQKHLQTSQNTQDVSPALHYYKQPALV